MPIRERCAVLVTPIFLRLLLGVVFLWAGLGKVLDDFHAAPADAAALAGMGVAVTASPPPSAAPAKEEKAAGGPTPLAMPVRADGKAYSPADFPDGAQVMRVYSLALTVERAAHPPAAADGAARTALWPGALAEGARPVYLAWAVALTEIIAGFFVLLGLVTRISAFALAAITAASLWLTQIGPAVQSGGARLGFLPAYPAFSAADWTPFFLQFALLMSALTLALAGPGFAGLDRAVFRRRSEPDDDGDAD